MADMTREQLLNQAEADWECMPLRGSATVSREFWILTRVRQLQQFDLQSRIDAQTEETFQLGEERRRLKAENEVLRAVVDAARAEVDHDCAECRRVWCAEREAIIDRLRIVLPWREQQEAAAY